MNKRILAISTYAGDAEFGCGGTIAKLIENKCDVTHVVLGAYNTSHVLAENSCFESAMQLGIPFANVHVEDFPPTYYAELEHNLWIKLLKYRTKCNTIFVPTSLLHGDYDVVFKCVESIWQWEKVTILLYESPMRRPWGIKNVYSTLKQKHVDQKLAAVNFHSQLAHTKAQFTEHYLKDCGHDIGEKYAEAFCLNKGNLTDAVI